MINKRGYKQEKNKAEPAQTMKFVWLSWVLSAIVLLLLYIMAMMLENPVRLLLTGKKTTGIVVVIGYSTGDRA